MIETGIKFDNIHSFYDLNLVLSNVEIEPATAKTTYIEIPGADGSLDLTEALGEIRYHDRTHKFLFTVYPQEAMTPQAKLAQVSKALNGKRFEKITLDKDCEYYYTGRCFVTGFSVNKKVVQILVEAIVRPYKLKHALSVYSCQLTQEERILTVTNGRKSVVPEITCTNNNTKIVFGDTEFKLDAGTHRILDIYMTEGMNVFKVSGTGTITIKYQEGEL